MINFFQDFWTEVGRLLLRLIQLCNEVDRFISKTVLSISMSWELISFYLQHLILERFLAKNQHSKRKMLYFEN